LEIQIGIASKCKQIEDENCKLEAMISKLEQTILDKDKAFHDEQEAWDKKITQLLKDASKSSEEASNKLTESLKSETAKSALLNEELEKAKSTNQLLESELEKFKAYETNIQSFQDQISEAREEVESFKKEMSRREELEEEKLNCIKEEIKTKDLQLTESLKNCKILQESLNLKENESKKVEDELCSQILNVRTELDVLQSERLILLDNHTSKEKDLIEQIDLLKEQICAKNTEYENLQKKCDEINQLLSSANEVSKVNHQVILEKQDLVNSLQHQLEELKRETSEKQLPAAQEDMISNFKQQLLELKDELKQLKVERDDIDGDLHLGMIRNEIKRCWQLIKVFFHFSSSRSIAAIQELWVRPSSN
jgi:hypothetical protein